MVDGAAVARPAALRGDAAAATVLALQRSAGNRAVAQLLARSPIPDEVLLTRAEIVRRLGAIEARAASRDALTDAELAQQAGRLDRLLRSPHAGELSSEEQERANALVVYLRRNAATRFRLAAPTALAGRPVSVSAGAGSADRRLSDAELRDFRNPARVRSELREIAGFGPLASLSFAISMGATGDPGQALAAGRAAALGDVAIASMGARNVREPQPRASAPDPEPTTPAWTARPGAGVGPRPASPPAAAPVPPAAPAPVPIPYPNIGLPATPAAPGRVPLRPAATAAGPSMPATQGDEAGTVREITGPMRGLDAPGAPRVRVRRR